MEPSEPSELRNISRHSVLKNIDYSFLGTVAKRMGLIPIKQRIILKKASGKIDDPARGLMLSARYGFVEAFKVFQALGSKTFLRATFSRATFSRAMILAARHGHIEIVELCQPHVNDYNKALCFAAEGGHYDIVDLLISWGANDFNGALRYAAQEGELSMVKYLRKRATDLDTPMTLAAGEGHLEVVEYLKQKGARGYDAAMLEAALNNHQDIVEQCLEWGATNYDETIRALADRNDEIVDLIDRYR